jgi:predicted HTH domain antitoxin
VLFGQGSPVLKRRLGELKLESMTMRRRTIVLDDDLVGALSLLDQPIDQAMRELVALELYRRGAISSGKAAQLVGMAKLDFIQYSGKLGIPFFRMTDDELDAEVARIRSL